MRIRFAGVLLAATLALPVGDALAARGHASATAAYRQGMLKVLKQFSAGNSKVATVGVDLSRSDFKKAGVDMGQASSQVQSAKTMLDHLKVPASTVARQIQSLYEQAFGTFVRGLGIMKQGVASKSNSKFTSGLHVYEAGLTPFNQANPLWGKLK
jgi:hypothetical protein